MAGCLNLDLDLNNWMSNLPTSLHKKPVTGLCIPGSHDSGTFSLDKNSKIAPNESILIKRLAKIFRSVAKNIVYKWSVTQNENLVKQLEYGARYLDLRVGYQPEVKEFRVVHGLYGLTCNDMFKEIMEFLDAHPKEILILDIANLVGFNDEAHTLFVSLLEDCIGKKLYGPSDLGLNSTLHDIWEAQKQVITIYGNPEIVQSNPLLWSRKDIESPWPNTSDVTTLLEKLDQRFENLEAGKFNVFQAILSPQTATIVSHPCKGNLEKTLAENCNTEVSKWLGKVMTEKKRGLNILICDFIGYNDIAEKVIKMNYMDSEI
eukprot:gene4239-4802_t